MRAMVFANKSMASRGNLAEQTRRWLDEAGTTPPGNGVERELWEACPLQPLKANPTSFRRLAHTAADLGMSVTLCRGTQARMPHAGEVHLFGSQKYPRRCGGSALVSFLVVLHVLPLFILHQRPWDCASAERHLTRPAGPYRGGGDVNDNPKQALQGPTMVAAMSAAEREEHEGRALKLRKAMGENLGDDVEGEDISARERRLNLIRCEPASAKRCSSRVQRNAFWL